jgi:hypothetical protein
VVLPQPLFGNPHQADDAALKQEILRATGSSCSKRRRDKLLTELWAAWQAEQAPLLRQALHKRQQRQQQLLLLLQQQRQQQLLLQQQQHSANFVQAAMQQAAAFAPAVPQPASRAPQQAAPMMHDGTQYARRDGDSVAAAAGLKRPHEALDAEASKRVC